MIRLLTVLLAGLLVMGCSDSRPSCYAPASTDRPPGRHVSSPAGVRVWAPRWLRDPLLHEALAEIDGAGTPAHLEVVIRDPGSFSTPASPSGLARGQTDMRSYVAVAWRMAPYETVPLLPALAHELEHVRTQDPHAGHGD